ncbi:MAG: hypothetical protein MUF20_14175 [Methylotetracoccus sp.]|nr:hypothetical protein [Methylotetracoccus sp.]
MSRNETQESASDPVPRLLTGTLPELGRGPRAGVKGTKELDALLADLKGGPSAPREVLRALALLWHDHWDVAHGIVQDLESEDAAYVHGIIHRREPDYGNAKYWFRRVNSHPAWSGISGEIRALRESAAEFRPFDLGGSPGRWEPLAFVDFCDAAARRPADDPPHRFAREAQAIEFRGLLRHLAKR